MLLEIMLLFAFLSFVISMRLTWVFNKLKRNATNKQVIPLANVMMVKSLLFSIMTGLISTEVLTYKLIDQTTYFMKMIHWHFGLVFIVLLFSGQLYLYWLTEMRNGWH